jgi:hypothetical protein
VELCKEVLDMIVKLEKFVAKEQIEEIVFVRIRLEGGNLAA